MADRVIFMGWERAVTGREYQAMGLWKKSMEYWGQLQADGRIQSFEPVIMAAHGGDLNGFFLIKGDEAKLDEIRREDTYINFLVEAGFCLEGFGAIPGYIGDGAADLLTRWLKLVED